MKLPSIACPTYEMVQTISNTKIKYRPFLTGEEKVLYLAMRTKEPEQIKIAVLQVLNNCILTPNIKAELLPIFDLEKLFLLIRGKAVGETINLNIPYKDDPNTSAPVVIPIDNINVIVPPDHTNIIKINESTSLIMRYPGLDMFLTDNFVDGDKDMFTLATECISELVVGSEVYKFEDSTLSEKIAFVDELPTVIFTKISEFLNNLPSLYFDVVVVNPETKVETKIRLEGVSSFFE
jgi:T4 bacteriophage base plate protein